MAVTIPQFFFMGPTRYAGLFWAFYCGTELWVGVFLNLRRIELIFGSRIWTPFALVKSNIFATHGRNLSSSVKLEQRLSFVVWPLVTRSWKLFNAIWISVKVYSYLLKVCYSRKFPLRALPQVLCQKFGWNVASKSRANMSESVCSSSTFVCG